LTWSRSQTGSITFNPEKLEIKALVDKNINLLHNSADIKGIKLSSTITSDFFVYADKEMVLSILRNLMTNAIKFSGADDRITIEAEDSGERITIHVIDTGVGISDKVIGKLFKVDESVKSTGTAKETGTGLGLILCKEFVAHHNGEIRVESKEGVGSRFSFTLPRFDEASHSGQQK
jgi:signal transduction histidine kinase